MYVYALLEANLVSFYRFIAVCESLRYGIDCNKVCHCPDGDTCDSVSGVCDSGRCHEFYYGSGCQIGE